MENHPRFQWLAKHACNPKQVSSGLSNSAGGKCNQSSIKWSRNGSYRFAKGYEQSDAFLGGFRPSSSLFRFCLVSTCFHATRKFVAFSRASENGAPSFHASSLTASVPWAPLFDPTIDFNPGVDVPQREPAGFKSIVGKSTCGALSMPFCLDQVDQDVAVVPCLDGETLTLVNLSAPTQPSLSCGYSLRGARYAAVAGNATLVPSTEAERRMGGMEPGGRYG